MGSSVRSRKSSFERPTTPSGEVLNSSRLGSSGLPSASRRPTISVSRWREAANTLSAIRYPDGIGQELVSAIKERGVVVAPGLHPEFKDRYFRVGHMGDLITRPTDISRCIDAVSDAVQATRAAL